MIAKTQAYTASDGSLHAKLEEAQAISLAMLFKSTEQVAGQADHIAKVILDQREQVLDILTTTSKSRPKRRLVNGYPGHKRSGKAKPVSAIAGVADAETA